jgi:RNA polymerase sigma factor (TIGR02999 family)
MKLQTIAEGFEELYPQLRAMASGLMRQERASHTLQPTAVVSEAFLRLAHRSPGEFPTIANLLAVCASTLRCVLVDHARSRSAAKRGASRRMGDAPLAFVQCDGLDPASVLAIEEALEELEAVDPRAVQVIECKVYAGMTLEEIALAHGVARPTVVRAFRFGRAFLASKLGIELADAEGE